MDKDAGEVRKGGMRVRLSGQPVQILLMLLSNPGEVVTREQLREQLWSDGTFVDFEHGLNAAINKLRRALNDSAERPRYVETVTGRGYRFVGTLEAAADTGAPVSAGLEPPRRSGTLGGSRNGRTSARWWLSAIVAVCLVGLVLLASRSRDGSDRELPWRLVRITGDSGVSDDGSLSPDGRLVAYSSDRAAAADRGPLTEGLDLYVKHVAGGSPIRLTFDGAGNRTPDFSPDGSRVVYRSSRDGGGLYEVPALGGTSRLIARGGLDPRYAPDGLNVAYWVGSPSIAESVPGTGEVWITSVAGRQPRRIAPSLTTARYPIWNKDGTHLLLVGYPSPKAFDSPVDWWFVSTDGSSLVRTGAYEALARSGLTRRYTFGLLATPEMPEPRCWSAVDGKVTFSMPTGDADNLWQLEVSPQTGKAIGKPQRLTTGGGHDLRPSCADGDTLVFSQLETTSDLWSFPFDLDRGAATGPPERITRGLQYGYPSPSLAQNGRTVAFTSDESGQVNVRTRDLRTGSETSVAASPLVQRYPTMSPSGAMIAFSVYENGKRTVDVLAPGGAPAQVCDGCLRATDWSRDEKTLVVFGGDPYRISTLDVASHRQTPLVVHPEHDVLYGRLSPDNQWISFTLRVQAARARIVIAPVSGPRPVPEDLWRTIADVEPDDYANWSPDGSTLYFTSGRDGYSCLWAERLDPGSHQPVGEAFAVQHFHGRLSFEHVGWAAAADRIVVPLVETTGNLWMMSRSER